MGIFDEDPDKIENYHVEDVSADENIKEDEELVDTDYLINPSIVEVENKEDKIQTSEYQKKELTESEKKAAIDLISAFSTHLSGNYKIDPGISIRSTIPTGIDVLDTILGGGVGTGLVQLVGPPGSGKSALAVKVLATGQKKYPGKFIGVYIDSEESMTSNRLAQLGVNNPPINPYTGVSVEKVFQIVEGLCAFKDQNPELINYPSCIVWDSIANTLTDGGIEKEDPNSVLGQKARILSHLLPKYVTKLNKYNICLLAINQLRDKIDMGIFKTPNDLKFLGDKEIPGGKSVKFNSIQLFFFRPTGDVKGEYGFSGTKVQGKSVKNKLFSPNIDIDLIFSFERGFSNFWTNFELLKNVKKIKSGAWCKIVGYEEKSFRQIEAIKLYKEDAKFRDVYNKHVKDTLIEEYIKKYGSTSTDQVDI